MNSRPAVFLMINTLETGGSERQFVTLANALESDRFSISLGCLKAIGPLVSEVDQLSEFPPGGSLFGFESWRARLALSRFLRRRKITVAHSFDFYTNLMLIPAARLAGVPVVVGSHRQLGDLLTGRQFHAQNAMFRLCDCVVSNSQAAAERLRRAGLAPEKLTVIANGISEDFFKKASPVLPPDPAVVRVGLISRMNHQDKHHDVFIRVAARLAPQFPQLRFVLAGDGPLRPDLESLVQQLDLSSRIIFLGDCRDVPAVLAALDVSVLPSSSESLSNVIMESMAAGLPVVASDAGGNPELVQDGTTGFLFPCGDEERFTKALQVLVTRPELRKQFGNSARAVAQAEYAIPRVRSQYQDLYIGALVKKGWIAPAQLQCQMNGAGREGS